MSYIIINNKNDRRLAFVYSNLLYTKPTKSKSLKIFALKISRFKELSRSKKLEYHFLISDFFNFKKC